MIDAIAGCALCQPHLSRVSLLALERVTKQPRFGGFRAVGLSTPGYLTATLRISAKGLTATATLRAEKGKRTTTSSTVAPSAPERRVRQVETTDNEDNDSENLAGLLSALPSPPAGFILAPDGHVALMAPPEKRCLTIVDEATGLPLECAIRRTFLDSRGTTFFLLLPLDTPIQIFRIDKRNNTLAEVVDDDVAAVLPEAAFALAKKSLHLVPSGFCFTARGAICYTEGAVIDLSTEYGSESSNEGVEICYFAHEGDEYTIFTPFDPLMFVAYKGEDGIIRVADDEGMMSDVKVVEALEEEDEFNDMVEEEENVMEVVREEERKRKESKR